MIDTCFICEQMNFDELTSFLEKRLREPMPGGASHEKMKPKLLNGAPFNPKHPVPPRKGGVLILFYQEEGEIRFPLIQRPNYEGIHSGQMALPGGKYEEYDTNQIQTALRESQEEIGVDRSSVEIIGNLSEFFVSASNYMVLPVVGFTSDKPKFVPEPREVDEVVTPHIQQLIDPRTLKEKQMTIRNSIEMICPYFDLEGRTVWGATAMMLREFVDIMQEFPLR